MLNIPGNINIERKQELCRLLALNLPVLRAKANLSQDELADRLGFSRQTISTIEGKKREMQWSTFSALILFFLRNAEIRKLMIVMGIVDDDVEMTFTIDLDRQKNRKKMKFIDIPDMYADAALTDYGECSDKPMFALINKRLYQKYNINANDKTEKALADSIHGIVRKFYTRVCDAKKTGIALDYELSLVCQLMIELAKQEGYYLPFKEFENTLFALQCTMQEFVKFIARNKSIDEQLEYEYELTRKLYVRCISDMMLLPKNVEEKNIYGVNDNLTVDLTEDTKML